MSASRERKQRQSDTGLTGQENKAAARAQAAKNKKIIYTGLGVVIAVLVAALLIWDSGVFQNAAAKNAVALTVGDKSYTTPYLNYFVNGYYQSYAQYGLVSSLDDQYSEEQTWGDYFTEEAIHTLTQVSILCDEAAKANYTLSEDDAADIDTTIKQFETSAAQSAMSYKTFLKAYYGDNMTPALHRELLEMITLASSFESNWTEQQDVTDSDIEAYYTENADSLDSYHYSTYTISGAAESTTDAEGKTVKPTEEQTAAAMAKAKAGAEAIQAALEAGDSVDALVTEYETTVSEDLSNTGGYLSADYAQFLQAVGRQPGDCLVVEGSSSYTVLVFKGREDYRQVDGYLPANVRHIFLKAEVSEGASAPTDEQMAASKAEAEELLAQWKAGDATAESFAALAEANSDDAGSNTNGGLYEGITKSTSFIANFIDWTFEEGRQAGDTGVIENTTSNGYHVMYLDSYGDTPVWKDSVASTLKNTAFNEWYEELEASYTITEGDLSYVGK